ncbi:MAG: twin-arginine translocation signal domain-containing protein, partial [Deltaproteobacteria bacterium]|nr:twin-arginine translocation signal domain-containing protein [Deltaproteobacteria bacterium]
MRARKAAGITRRDFVRYVGSVTTVATAMAAGIGLPN